MANGFLKPGAKFSQITCFGPPFPKKQERKTDGKSDVNKSWPIVRDFHHYILNDRLHPLFEWPRDGLFSTLCSVNSPVVYFSEMKTPDLKRQDDFSWRFF